MKEKLHARIARVQNELKAHKLDAWIVTGTDPHQTEYLPPHWMEREGITGFTGSAGTVVILQDEIHLWVDSRYYVQAEKEVQGTPVTIHKLGLPKVLPYNQWLCKEMPSGATVGVDGMTISFQGCKNLRKELVSNGITLESRENLFLPLWEDRPKPVKNPVVSLDSKYTGETREQRLLWAATKLTEQRADALLVTDQANVGYILNLRGSALPYNPVFEAFLLIESVSADKAKAKDNSTSLPKATLFIDQSSISEQLASELTGVVTIAPYDAISEAMTKITGTLLIDPSKAPYTLATALTEKAKIKEVTPHPITAKKAVKTEQEIEQLKEAHRRDGAAMVNFLHWFDSIADKETLTEWDTMEKIREFRAAQPEFQDESFATIAGYKENGVLNHYHANKESATPLAGQGLMVFDSGGQYLCGTTDITRTLLIGEPTKEQISDYTAVLRGHITLATAVFPENTYGHQLDILARKPLWDLGRNYGHGTGHGVGFFMNVHEGPMSISPKGINVPLEPGMYLSNEPGLYREKKHGIRLENLVLVEARADVPTDFCNWLGFETLTLAPFERKLIDTSILTSEEREWLNDYHAGVYAELAPLLEESVQEWLAEVTAEI